MKHRHSLAAEIWGSEVAERLFTAMPHASGDVIALHMEHRAGNLAAYLDRKKAPAALVTLAMGTYHKAYARRWEDLRQAAGSTQGT